MFETEEDKANKPKKDSRWYNFNLAGFTITIDPMMPLIVVLVAWLLSARYYPQFIFMRDTVDYWIMGGVTSLLLTVSILVHELGHAITARYYNLPIERIHLFLLGGMAELRHRPIRASHELMVAIAGPTTSMLFAGMWYVLATMLDPVNHVVSVVAWNVGLVNLMLGGFNLVPVFPLDGGRALRALIWIKKKRYYRASQATYLAGKQIIGLLFMVAVVSYFFFDRNLTFWLGLFGLYMMYTIFNGRKELTYVPKIEDLVLNIEADTSPKSIIEHIREKDERYLPKTIIPVINGNGMEHVVYGHDLNNNNSIDETALLDIYRPVEAGTFVEIENLETYDPQLSYKADFVPVFQNGDMMGLCDAHEMRFWLLEQYRTL